jgi:epsilon-lactone hydrolase
MRSMASRILEPYLRLNGMLWMRARYPVGYVRFFMNKLMPASVALIKFPCKRKDVTIGDIPAAWFTSPGADEDRVLLYLHGGGYVIGCINVIMRLAGEIATSAGCKALVLDYRLAPEDPFPAALDDTVAAYRWLLSNGYKQENIVIAGDSAGAGLTAAALVTLRSAGDPLPAAGMLICPWTDLEGTGETLKSNARKEPMLNEDILIAWAEMYLNGTDPRIPLASPFYADLEGLPPLYIQTGSHEVLFDDARHFAEAAKGYGVPIELEVFEGMTHDWHLFHFIVPEARDAVQKLGLFCREKMDAAARSKQLDPQPA